ncbi:hypothetical protein LX64_00315 [Chitinophaga skermanii]|uniref:Uncharacterized protein n=1 Tax=Chitinophaga skermanii TaxID=331697 RepID=A0A327R1I1_9BACT|nr:hypothetical protein [Chitinophaga skermanii]RAJ10709.1 hypothetical protein LX64_00315 [Chitinophaga skermanii]
MILFNQQLPKVDLHKLCNRVAQNVKVPEALVCFLLFERLYAIKQHEAIIFLFESELAKLVHKLKGRFEMIPAGDQLQLKFSDGSILAHKNATITWFKLFELAYIDCSPKQITRANDELSNLLYENHTPAEQSACIPV